MNQLLLNTSSKEQKTPIKQKKLLNIYATTWISLATLLIISDSIFSTDPIPPLIGHASTILGLLLVLFFNYKGYYFLASSLLVFGGILSFSVFAILLSPGIYAEFYLFMFPCIASSLFTRHTISIATLIFSFMCFSFIIINYNYYNTRYPGPAMLILFTALFLIINYFKKNNLKNEELLKSEKIIIEKQAKELEKLNEFKTHFFVNLSHEIRTPVTLIKGYASKIELPQNDKNNKNLEVVNSQVQQIEIILNNILDLNKLDDKKLNLERKNVPIIPFLNKHFADFKALFIKKDINFNLNSNSHLVIIDMDEDLISKSINNLLNNALKFTPRNGEVTINVVLNEALKISVIDNGPGIPKEDLIKIFERFYQSKNDITKSRGSGIGLSFTKSILDAHGFSIYAKSIPNIKTEFTITIPKKDILYTKENQASIANKNKINYKKNGESPVILVVDDHEQMRDYLKSILNSYDILQAENGEEALHILKHQAVDLLLTDYMMPVMNGEELVKHVKKLKLKIPVIIITASVNEATKLNMLRIGVDGYLTKPFIEEELLLFITKSLKAYATIIEFEEELDDDEIKEFNEYAHEFNKEISKIINDNISKVTFGVQDVANHFDISKRTLNRKVKSILGQTTQQLIIASKIEKAKELKFKKPDMSKKEIALAVGMTNPGHLFKKLNSK